MHQTRKGKQWYFGLKAHIGVDSKQGHVHSVCLLDPDRNPVDLFCFYEHSSVPDSPTREL